MAYGYTPQAMTPVKPDAQYQSVMQGYGNALAAQQARSQGISQGYSNLYKQQANYGDSQRFALQQQYGQQMAQSQQSMVGRGLTSSSAFDSAAQGIGQGYAVANMGLQDQLLQRQNQIRMAGLGYQDQALQQYMGLQGQQLGYMGQYGAGQQQQYGNYMQGYNQHAWGMEEANQQAANQELVQRNLMQAQHGYGSMGGGGGFRAGFSVPLTRGGTGGYSPYGSGLFGNFTTGA